MNALDSIDRSLLRLLQQNARMSNRKLAEEVGLSPSACLRRIRILEESGAIRGYTAILDPATQEAAMSVLVNITLERQTEDYLTRFEAAVRKLPEVHECYLMTGGSDYFLRAEIENPGQFERFHTEVLSTLPGVSRIHSSFTIRNVLRSRRRGRSRTG